MGRKTKSQNLELGNCVQKSSLKSISYKYSSLTDFKCIHLQCCELSSHFLIEILLEIQLQIFYLLLPKKNKKLVFPALISTQKTQREKHQLCFFNLLVEFFAPLNCRTQQQKLKEVEKGKNITPACCWCTCTLLHPPSVLQCSNSHRLLALLEQASYSITLLFWEYTPLICKKKYF